MTRIMLTFREDQYMFLNTYCSVLLRVRNVSDGNCGEDQNTQLISVTFYFENLDIYHITWKIIVKPDRPQMRI